MRFRECAAARPGADAQPPLTVLPGCSYFRPFPPTLFASVNRSASIVLVGRAEDGLGIVTETLAKSEARGYDAEMHRLKGELLLKRNDLNRAQAQTCFRRAIEISRKQSAKSFELRATMSFTRLLASEGRREEARAMLAEIYNWFTEGFDTADLKDAKALLDQLGA
jgi:predicted ATPase